MDELARAAATDVAVVVHDRDVVREWVLLSFVSTDDRVSPSQPPPPPPPPLLLAWRTDLPFLLAAALSRRRFHASAMRSHTGQPSTKLPLSASRRWPVCGRSRRARSPLTLEQPLLFELAPMLGALLGVMLGAMLGAMLCVMLSLRGNDLAVLSLLPPIAASGEAQSPSSDCSSSGPAGPLSKLMLLSAVLLWLSFVGTGCRGRKG